jgi:hypothetical protein
MRGFMPKAKKVKEYNDKKWDKTGHDLDLYLVEMGWPMDVK